jgi:hypothetical protein
MSHGVHVGAAIGRSFIVATSPVGPAIISTSFAVQALVHVRRPRRALHDGPALSLLTAVSSVAVGNLRLCASLERQIGGEVVPGGGPLQGWRHPPGGVHVLLGGPPDPPNRLRWRRLCPLSDEAAGAYCVRRRLTVGRPVTVLVIPLRPKLSRASMLSPMCPGGCRTIQQAEGSSPSALARVEPVTVPARLSVGPRRGRAVVLVAMLIRI